MNEKYHFFMLCVFCFAISLNTNAQQINTDRPDQTESTLTIPRGSVQIEAGVLFQTDNLNAIDSHDNLLPTILTRIGFGDNFELRIVNQIEQRKAFGISDLEIGAKINFVRSESSWNIAFLSHLVIPTGTSQFSNHKLGSINKIAISNNINNYIDVGANIGYNYLGKNNGDLTYSVSFAFKINNKLGFYIEPFGEIENLKTHFSNLDGGFTYLIKSNIQADISYGNALNYNSHYLSVGISWLFLKDKKE